MVDCNRKMGGKKGVEDSMPVKRDELDGEREERQREN
jgi:hypothetical protein